MSTDNQPPEVKKDLQKANSPKKDTPRDREPPKLSGPYYVVSRVNRRFEIHTPVGTAIFLKKGEKPANKMFADGIPEKIYQKYFDTHEQYLVVTKEK